MNLIGTMMKNRSVIDIFCGVGGLTHGFVREDFSVLAGVDADASCRYPFEQNNGARFIHKEIEELEASEIRDLFPDDHIKILVGCAPCTPYSTYTQKQDKKKKGAWRLLTEFADLIVDVQPDIVSMENVTRLRKFNGGSVFNGFVKKLETAGYQVSDYDIYCPDYGVPQNRTRLVLFASRFGKIALAEKTLEPDYYRTVRDVISDLPEIEHGGISQQDEIHRASGLTPINLKRIRASKPGGTWRDWNDELIAECHKKKTGKTYPSVYGRMVWDKLAPTITTQCFGFGNGRFGHPEQDRAISLREAALLQSFPPNYVFVKPGDPVYFHVVGRHIGNAVPPALGRAIAMSIRMHLEAFCAG